MSSPEPSKASHSSSARGRDARRRLLSALDRWRRRTSGEDGFVVVLAITVLLIGMLLGGAAITQTTNTENTVRRDGSSKRALQAARAGIQAGTLLAVASAKNSWTSCPTKSVANTVTNVAPTGGWCPPVTQDVGANERFEYRLSAPYAAGSTTARDIVATGIVTAGTGSAAATRVTRRVRQTLVATPGGAYNPFDEAGLIGVAKIELSANVTVGTETSPVHIHSGGSITNTGQNTVELCGNVRPGPGQTVTLSGASTQCGGQALPGSTLKALEPVTPPIENDNGQAALNPGAGWNSLTRVLNVTGNLTLTGNTYVFCQLTVNSGRTLRFEPATTGPIRIYFDTPEKCQNISTPLNLDSNSGSVTKGGNYPLQIYVAGDTTTTAGGTPSTSVTLSSNITSLIGAIYAPNSKVEINSNNTYYGTIAAKELVLRSRVDVYNFDGDPGDIDVGNGAGSSPPSYNPTTFVECTSAGGTNSTTGC